MKARRGFQITLGVWALMIVGCLVLMTLACVIIALIPGLPSAVADIPAQLKDGFTTVADTLNMGSLYYVIPLIFYAFPAVLLVTGAGLLLSRNKGKRGKYIAGCVLTLIGAVIVTEITMACAKLFFGTYYVPYLCTAAGVLIVTVLFATFALGIRRKKKPVAESEQTDVPAETEVQEASPLEVQTEEQPSEQTPYVPEEMSVGSAVEEVYGKEEPQHVSNTRLDTLKMLLEVGAITEEEYMKLLSSYLK